MTAAALLQLHVEQALLLALGWTVFGLAWRWSSRPAGRPEPRRWRSLALGVVLSAMILPFLARAVPRKNPHVASAASLFCTPAHPWRLSRRVPDGPSELSRACAHTHEKHCALAPGRDRHWRIAHGRACRPSLLSSPQAPGRTAGAPAGWASDDLRVGSRGRPLRRSRGGRASSRSCRSSLAMPPS